MLTTSTFQGGEFGSGRFAGSGESSGSIPLTSRKTNNNNLNGGKKMAITIVCAECGVAIPKGDGNWPYGTDEYEQIHIRWHIQQREELKKMHLDLFREIMHSQMETIDAIEETLTDLMKPEIGGE